MGPVSAASRIQVLFCLEIWNVPRLECRVGRERVRTQVTRLGRVSKSTIGTRVRTPIDPETTIEIRDEYITLQQLLKMAGMIGTGGEAKYYLAEMAVMVNGEQEQRRGRKLRPGDLINAPGEIPIRIVTEPGGNEKDADDE